MAFFATCGFWSATSSGRANKIVFENHQTAYPVSDTYLYYRFCVFSVYSRPDCTYLHGYAGFKTYPIPLIMGVVLSLSGASTRQCLFQSVSGTGNTRTALAMELCVLAIYVTYATYFILYLRMDVAFPGQQMCIRHFHPVASVINAWRKETVEKKIESFFTIFARK